ncbi:MAG TPA: glycosyltransferase family 4 protein, partial [Actinomycetota bacterium]|nr:glycosyltransferase family 4 protein [Actinomycetota bacterium]
MVTNDFPPRVGGVNGYVAELMRRFPPGDVTVFAADWLDAPAFDAPYPQRVVRWPAKGMYPTAPVRDRVEELVRETGADIVLFGAAAPLALMGRSIQRRTGIPYATFTHGVEVWAGQVPVTRGLLGSVTRGAVLTMGVSDWAVQQLRQGTEQVSSSPPGG